MFTYLKQGNHSLSRIGRLQKLTSKRAGPFGIMRKKGFVSWATKVAKIKTEPSFLLFLFNDYYGRVKRRKQRREREKESFFHQVGVESLRAKNCAKALNEKLSFWDRFNKKVSL